MGYGQNNQNQERQAFSLLELNNRVKGVVLNAFPETCWVRAEMSAACHLRQICDSERGGYLP